MRAHQNSYKNVTDPIQKPLLLREIYSGTCSQKLLEILFKALLQQNSTKYFLQFVSSHSHLIPLCFAPITLLKLTLSRSSQTSTLPHPGLGRSSSFFLTHQSALAFSTLIYQPRHRAQLSTSSSLIRRLHLVCRIPYP